MLITHVESLINSCLALLLYYIQQAAQRQRAARESRIVMYRKYRTGDLPDIQIKFSELITPLQAVAQVRIRWINMRY